MPGYQTRLQYLYQQFITDQASPEEIHEFWQLMKQADENDPIHDSVSELYEQAAPEELTNKDWRTATIRLKNQTSRQPRQRIRHWWWAAASIMLLTGGYSVFQFSSKTDVPLKPVALRQPAVNDIPAPESNRATITLANGKKIYLDSSASGMLATQNNVSLKKTADAAIVYDLGSSSASTDMIFNTLTNPRGSKVINITLSDGSHLWLNSSSSVTFPVAFSKHERNISITGEAYLEVAHDASRKFKVHANGVTTEVLGTHFNVKAYEDEAEVKVTLLEGAVKTVLDDGQSAMLTPGQQAAVQYPTATNAQLKINKHPDVEEVLAWKNDRFSFNDTGIQQIMKQVSRWYDVDIQYDGEMEGLSFGGNMSRQKNVSELLKRLEATKAVKFAINGRKIIVTKTD
jgi:ferric-dicitrate binding protein FerR (iron transport regulator)